MTIIIKDDAGREIFFQKKDFLKYIAGKEISLSDVLALTPANRWTLYIKWKHGLCGSDPKNIDVSQGWYHERELQHFLREYDGKELEDVEPGIRMILKSRREFEDYCDKIKGMIGIAAHKVQKDLPQSVKDLADSVGGTVVKYE